ncbi:hypothetical protein PI125_g16887 [Phytophthora idaei]|nr:hypothetical protein PI125_g16887 [Phytophthora idaei]
MNSAQLFGVLRFAYDMLTIHHTAVDVLTGSSRTPTAPHHLGRDYLVYHRQRERGPSGPPVIVCSGEVGQSVVSALRTAV